MIASWYLLIILAGQPLQHVQFVGMDACLAAQIALHQIASTAQTACVLTGAFEAVLP